MKRWYQLLTTILIGAFFLLPEAVTAAQTHGTFRVVKGDVKVQSPNGKVKKARVGRKVFPKDKIITAKDSRAKIIMVDKNVINVSPSSEVVFEKYEYEPKAKKKDVLLNVIYGKVRSKVNQKYDGASNKFRVKTPSAVAGVRGTDFFTSYNRANKRSSVVTFEGEVRYGTPGANGSIQNAVSVRAGQMATNIAGKPPAAPKSVPKRQLANMDKSSDADKAPAVEKREPANKQPQEGDKKNKKDGKAKKGDDQAGKKQQGEPKKQGAADGAAPAEGNAPAEGKKAGNDRGKKSGPKNSANNARPAAGSGGSVAAPVPGGIAVSHDDAPVRHRSRALHLQIPSYVQFIQY